MDTYSANEVIEIAVQVERNGYEYYQEALKRHDLDTEMKELMKFLSGQEKKHEQTFLKMRENVDKIELETTMYWEEVAAFLKAIVENRIFNNPEAAIAKAKKSQSKEELLNTAMQFEKDTLLYYQSIYSLTKDDRIKDMLLNIISEEMTHIVKLGLFLDKWL